MRQQEKASQAFNHIPWNIVPAQPDHFWVELRFPITLL